MNGDCRHRLIGIETRQTEFLTDQSAGQLLPLQNLHLGTVEFRGGTVGQAVGDDSLTWWMNRRVRMRPHRPGGGPEECQPTE